ncbi:MAG: PAS domain-containing sensor histidine kinase [Pseudomonadota bacterium]
MTGPISQASIIDDPLRAEPAPELLARAFNAAPNGFVIVDQHGKIIAANTELEAMFGYSEGTLIGTPVEALLPLALKESHAALRQAFHAKPERRAMGAGRVLYARRQSGQEFPVEIGLNPLSSPQGPLVLASVVDITDRLALEEAFRGLFDASPYGLLIVDDAGKIVMANRVLADVLGYTSSALVGQPLHLLLPERYRPRHGQLMAGYRTTGESRMMGSGRDLTALHRDGTELPVEIGLSRVQWQRQTVTLAAISDISVRKRLEHELHQANSNLEEFTYVASHDLRSPLRGIADLVEWIQGDLKDDAPSDVFKNLGRISHRIQRMERLIDDLLSYARAGRAATAYSLVDIEDLVRGTLEIQPPPRSMEIQLDLQVAPFLATKTPLETALRNLLGNAIKHHDRPTGLITIRAREDDSYCEISIIDDGPGVPGASKDRIFKLFQTLTASERGASGIGLALTKRVVEVHGGRIELTSPVAAGRGACFKFWWPRFPRRTSDDT